MRWRYSPRKAAPNRFERFNIVLTVLLAGWVPSILVLWLSYTILSSTLESKIRWDRQSFVQLVSQLIADDLSRTGAIVSSYQKLPALVKIFTGPNQQLAAQQWLGATLYQHPRVDGMFLANRDGRLMGALPSSPAIIGRDFHSELWKEQAAESNTVYVSPIHRRLGDNQLVADIVGAIRNGDNEIAGYLGVSVLVERMGQRLSAIPFADQSICQILDQNGDALFTNDLKPNTAPLSSAGQAIAKSVLRRKQGELERFGNFYVFNPVGSTGWVVMIEQPDAFAFKAVYDWRRKTIVLAAWLMGSTAALAWLSGLFYRRQRAAARRIEREEFFNEKILANMPTGIALVDPTSRKFLQANEAFIQMAKTFGGLTPDADILETTCEAVKIVPPAAIEKVRAFGAPFQLVEQPFADADGKSHFVNVNLVRLLDSDEAIQGLLYLVEDKTHDVALRRELISANAAKDQFLALLSHELRNPLSPVIAMVKELEQSAPRTTQIRQALDVIRRNVELEARLIDDLLDITRISKGKLQLNFELVSVHETLRRAFEICQGDIAAKKITAALELNARDEVIEGDPARLQQVLWNLIKNSVKFTPANGRVSIATRNTGENEMEISVSDSGIGIDKDKLDKIFNAFEQGQSSITRRFGGLGLGLAISKAMVEAHGGKITVTSAGKDQGATVTVTLKTIPASVAANQPDGQPQKKTLGQLPKGGDRRRILFVDDHPDTCVGMKLLLERRGYDIDVANSAEQALKKAEEHEFDLVISDIGLPDRTGYDLMRELHQRKGLRGIAISGYGMEHDVASAHTAGFSHHLTKPINFERLEQSIRNLLEPEPVS